METIATIAAVIIGIPAFALAGLGRSDPVMRSQGEESERIPVYPTWFSVFIDIIHYTFAAVFKVLEIVGVKRYSIVNSIDPDFAGFGLCDDCIDDQNCQWGHTDLTQEFREKLQKQGRLDSRSRNLDSQPKPQPEPDFKAKQYNPAKPICLKMAISMGIVSKIAYEAPPAATREFIRLGFKIENMRSVTVGITQAYVIANDKAIFVAFRGTRPLSIIDWVLDMKVARRIIRGGKIHHGFMDGLDLESPYVEDSAFTKIVRAIMRLQRYDTDGYWMKKLYFTGHSLGGAFATGAVFKTIELNQQSCVAGIYTYGSPKCGDMTFIRNFSNKMHERSFRFVNNNDIIPRMPLSKIEFPGIEAPIRRFSQKDHLNNAQVGRLLFLNRQEAFAKKDLQGSFRWYLWESIVVAKINEIIYFFEQKAFQAPWRKRLFKVLFPLAAVNDHFPGDYVRALRTIRQKSGDHYILQQNEISDEEHLKPRPPGSAMTIGTGLDCVLHTE
eukprot:TRINITY_DN1405_c0_g1_i4.p1 TRINITY_DN1405_c0_g1~~TRINITY_DN1405_c0_g1_i4.p1  ORF type:complete len:497 (-),score=130.00 TRINITY_DN1405_c0_g1_i4:80-1570(-)